MNEKASPTRGMSESGSERALRERAQRAKTEIDKLVVTAHGLANEHEHALDTLRRDNLTLSGLVEAYQQELRALREERFAQDRRLEEIMGAVRLVKTCEDARDANAWQVAVDALMRMVEDTGEVVSQQTSHEDGGAR